MIYNFNDVPPSTYQQIIKSQEIRPRFRLTLLNSDESFQEDISDYMIPSGSNLSISYNQGQRRSLTLMLDNKDGRFTPNGINSIMWINSKVKLELGIETSMGDIIYNSAGIFCVGNPQVTSTPSEKNMSIQLYDKFAMLDGTLGGILETTYLIKANEKVIDIFKETLLQDNGNGYPIDIAPLVFDSNLADFVTQYELSKSPNESLGSILIDLANMMAADVYYGVNGNLVVKSGLESISQINKPTLWAYSDNEYEYFENNITYDYTSCKNHITVVGANSNGDMIYVGEAINTNPQSPTRVSIIGTKRYYLEDSNIYSTDLALQRAEYELNKLSILQNTINIKSSFMIHLDVNNCISITDDYFDYFDDRFLIQSINIPITLDSQIDIECTNIATLPYYN